MWRVPRVKTMESTWDVTSLNRQKMTTKWAPQLRIYSFWRLWNAVFKDEDNSWVAPLPFREPRPHLPNKRSQAADRLSSLRRSFGKKPEMKDHFISFMEKKFQSGHAQVAPPLGKGEECWYLPCFGVYHPKKPSQIRVVFYSSAQHKGVSLNQVPLTGPDLNNSLLGVLIRFCKDSIAITADM